MPKDVYANAEKNLAKLKAGKLGRIAKLKRTAKELLYGERTYLPKGSPKVKKPKKKKKKKVGRSQFEGASGGDLAELQKRFGRKK